MCWGLEVKPWCRLSAVDPGGSGRLLSHRDVEGSRKRSVGEADCYPVRMLLPRIAAVC